MNASDLKANYYLDIAHHASLTPTALSFRDAASPFYVYRTLLPLSNEHIKALRRQLYTARFRVQGQKAYRYDFEKRLSGQGVVLPGVPDGLYEFYLGTAYAIKENGQRTALDANHPLYQEALTTTLFNSGVDWSPIYQFKESVSVLMPFRYVYFDEGNLKCLDAVLMEKEDPALKRFMADEMTMKEATGGLYPSFTDEGKPSKEKIKQEGLQLSASEVMLLGDNHAGSGDSRDFGLATYSHLQGSPFWRFWPLSSLQTGIDSPYRGFNRYDITIWLLLGLFGFLFEKWRRWRFERAKAWVHTQK
jgi:hypothetical protein